MTGSGLQFIAPRRSLRSIVRGFWAASGSATGQSTRTVIIPASPRAGFMACFKGDFYCRDRNNLLWKYPNIFLVGMRTAGAEVTVTGDYSLFGTVFHPEVYRHLNLTAPEDLVDCSTDITDVLGRVGKDFEERLHSAPTFRSRTEVAPDFLENHFRKANIVKDKFDLLIDDIHTGLFRQGVAETAQACNMSVRHFHRRFKDATGVSPKKYKRIIRFRKAFGVLSSMHHAESLAAVAYRFGYADQAHFIREFTEFSGAPPLRFLTASRLNPLHELVEGITGKYRVA